jgi:hypothetical protein
MSALAAVGAAVLAGIATLIGAVYADRVAAWQSAQERGYEQAVRLLQEFATIERAAKGVLGETESASPIRIRYFLLKRGTWSEVDVAAFDTAVRVRNEVVHGDTRDIDRASLEEARVTMQRLHKKLQPGMWRVKGSWVLD